MLGAHRIFGPHTAQKFGGKTRHADEADRFAAGQGVADPQVAVIGNADDVAGPGLLGQFPVPGQKEHRIVDVQGAPGAGMEHADAAKEPSGAQAHEGDPVPVLRVHVRLDLEDETGDRLLLGGDRPFRRLLGPGRRRVAAKTVEQGSDAKAPQGASEVDRRPVALEIGRGFEWRAEFPDHFDLFAELVRRSAADRLVQVGTHEAGHDPLVTPAFLRARLEQDEAVAHQVVAALEAIAHADGPGDRRHLQLQRVGDLVEQIERVARLAVELVDEGRDRHVPQAADLEQFSGLRLDALGGVENHDGRVDGGQCAVGVFAEVLVAWRVEQVEAVASIAEGHDRRADRDAPFALDLHPVRTGPPRLAARFHGTGKLNRARVEKELLGERRLARVRVRDDGERPASGDRIGKRSAALGRPRFGLG